MQTETRFFAHTPVRGGDWHDLISHLKRTADLARKNGTKFGAGELAHLAGLWHDIGKFNPDFQEYLRHCERAARVGEKPPQKSVPHAVYGAIMAWESVSSLAPAIYGHHAGLPQLARLQSVLAEDNQEVREVYERIMPTARERVSGLLYEGDPGALISDPPRDPFQMEFFLRMVFSALVDADFLDTETHFDPDISRFRGAELTPADLWPVLEKDQERLISNADPTPVNAVRREVYAACLQAAELPQGVFRLSVPTGGGKTRSGLAFALKHAICRGLDRVIYAVPYTSIIEQTASEFRRIFADLGDGAVLEHHSAVTDERRTDRATDPEEAERLHETRTRARLAAQNWDAPLVVTTTVQLFESLLANRTSRCRKLHNIARSVILLDEVQTLPLRLLDPTVDVLKELARRYEVSIVLCTATQPALETNSRYLKGFEPGSVRDIVPETRASEHFRSLKRVEYEIPAESWSWEETARRLKEAAPERQALVVLNSRRDALTMLEALDDDSALHLSTLLCGANRRDILAEIRRRLREKEPCLLVATQVVEAGVDLDFPVVFRAAGPLDRIVQAAGRCNREGKMDHPGRVVVFRPDDGRGPGGEYASARDQTEMLLRREGFDLHDPSVFREYFELMYQLVSTDARGIQELRRSLDYPEVAARYRLIEDDTVPVVVEYPEKDRKREEERVRMLERIRRGVLLPGDHRRLQPYVVGLRSRELKEFEYLTEDIAEGVKLWTGEYDPIRGISAIRSDPADLIW
ncbi:MAG: CRISPR-associated helicase Cas3' [Actinomycetota bacterium]